MLNVDKSGLVWLDDLTGGLNDTDAPQDLAPNQCQIAQNVEWVTTRFAQRRQGGVNTIHPTEPWTADTFLRTAMRHTPTADEGTAELWAVDDGIPSVTGRLAGSNQFVAVATGDLWQDNRSFINGTSLNGKFFVAGDTPVDRLHVWDGATFRRGGIATPAAPTVANQGVGTYAAVLRYYKVQWQSGAVHSELSPAVAFTPSGTGAAARVTIPALPSGDTVGSWILWGSPDGVNFYPLNSFVIATTFADDTAAPSSYSTIVPPSGLAGAGRPSAADYYTPPISPKYLLTDEDRLILLSSWETASMASAVMWTPVIGTTPAVYAIADDERVPSTNRLDLDRQDGGGITGGAILNGTIYVFKQSQIYRLVRTGNVTLPYRGVPVTKSLGALGHKSLVVGEDETGTACLYFLSRRGPYRITADGALEYLGRDIETLWKTVNLTVTTANVPAFGVWHEAHRQVQWWVATGAATLPDQKLVFHARHGHRTATGTVRGGWAIHTDGAADAFCAVMFANTLGATMSLDLKPYVGERWIAGLPDGPCFKYDADGVTTDRGPNATSYVARVKSSAFPPGGNGQKGGILSPYVLGTPSNRTLAVDFVRDFGLETRSGTAVMPVAVGTETRTLVKVENDAALADAMYAELVVDDEGLGNSAWSVDAVGFRPRGEGPI